MKKTTAFLFTAILMAAIFTVAGLHAGTEVEDTFEIDTKEYKKKKKAPPKFKHVTFTHKKHTEEYKIGCGDCHHDEDGKPLDLKIGDDVQRCVECHTKLKKDKENKKDIMVLENAMHGNCITCHKEFNKEKGDPKDPKGLKGPAPATCGKCHISLKKKKKKS